jgi:tetratricopeptide (TPR) repeat protein
VNILTIRRNLIRALCISPSQGGTMNSAHEVIVRGMVQLVGALAVVAGLIGWISGWQYGHGLVTLGLVVYVSTFFTRRMSFRRSWGQLELMQADGDDALQHVDSAVRSFRKLAAKRPGEATYLANTLDKQWTLLAAVDKHDEALPIAREAVETWRAVVIDNPSHRVNLSRALNHVAVSLGCLDRDEESVPYNEEAIVVQRALVVDQEYFLAQHLANQAISLRRCDRWEEALPVATEATVLYRRVVPTNPEALEDAMQAAERLFATLGHLGRNEEAVPAAQEWVGYERARTAAAPDRAPELAEAVRVLGGTLLMAGRRDDGLNCWRESLELRRRLAEAAGEHRPAYAEACSTIAHGFASLGEAAEALAVFRTGLTVRRELAATAPEHHGHLLTELAQAAFSTRVYTGNTEPAAAVFAAEATTCAREHAASISRSALAEAAELLDRADFDDEARELEEISARTASS